LNIWWLVAEVRVAELVKLMVGTVAVVVLVVFCIKAAM
jgi:hypothetical protein